MGPSRVPLPVRIGVLTILALPPLASHELRLTTGQGFEPSVDLVLISTAEVQGLVAAFDWDGRVFAGSDLLSGPVLATADLVVRRVEPAFMVLGVVMDSDGRDGEVIPPGTSILATARFRCVTGAIFEDDSTAITFRDGVHGTAQLGPALDNLITVGGQTISAAEGLVLSGGRLVCPAVVPGTLRLRDTTADPETRCAAVDVLLDSPSPVQGYSLAVAHDPAALSLTAITIAGTAASAAGADFSASNIFPDGGTLGVVMDLNPPFLGNTIPAGTGLVIARFGYCCRVEPPEGGPAITSPIRFVDAVLGDPPLENVLVVSGQGVAPAALIPGTFTCPAPSGEKPQEFRCGGPPLLQLEGGLAGVLPPVTGFPGSTVKLGLYYRSIPQETTGDLGEDQIQGLSVALCFDPRFLECRDGTFDVRGTITEAVGAEFVNSHCESTTADGDGGELIIGILVDSLPPFDGQTLPPTRDLLEVGRIDFRIAPDAPCGECLPVSFCDGIDGQGRVPTRNLISVNNFSRRPAFFDCEICVKATPLFQRGDCNSSRGGALAVDIADPAAVISFLFGGPNRYRPACLDACDANDDGRVDFADPVHVLRYLFKFGSPPPAPGPDTPGPDSTEDNLGCEGGSVCIE